MLPPPASRLMAAADPDPIVVVNLSPLRCDAFLVERDRIRVERLPQLTLSDVNERTAQLRASHSSLISVLAWLWRAVVQPTLSALGFDRPPSFDSKWPRVWWVPVGPLSYLPLHAAGYHWGGSGGEATIDRVMSPYSSSIQTLMAGRQRALPKHPVHPPGKALLVSMPEIPGQSPLPFTESEVEMLAEICPSMNFTPIKLRQPERKQDILDQLRTCSIFHFAGHGLSHPSQPSRSCLLLQDWETDPLTVDDLRTKRLQDHAPFLAFLSACSTSANEEFALVDEAVHLANACQLAGFRHVVGTQWAVSDSGCVEVARHLYKTICEEGATDDAVCRGLHHALRAMRGGHLESCAGRDGGSQDGDSLEGITPVTEADERADMKWDNVAGNSGEEEFRKGVGVGPRRRNNLLWVPYVHFGV